MKLLFILDQLSSLKPEKDTSLAIMRELARRGHELFVAEQTDLVIRDHTVSVHCKKFSFNPILHAWKFSPHCSVSFLKEACSQICFKL